MSELIYRQMTEQDVPAVAALDKRCFSVPWSEQMFLDVIGNRQQYFCVVTEDDTIIAYAGMMIVLDEGQVMNVAVDDGYRHRGIGRGLMNALITYGRTREVTFYTLEVREGNTAARSLYRKIGFRDTGRRPDYYYNPTEAAILMDYTDENSTLD